MSPKPPLVATHDAPSTEPGAPLRFRALRDRERDLAALAVIGVVSLFLFWVRARLPPDYINNDNLTQFMPLYTAVGDRLRAGELPGWNPAIFSGMPLAGDALSGWGYLPSMSFFALFGPLGAWQAHLLFHIALAGFATYALGRRLGLAALGALAASLAYQLGPHFYFSQCCTDRMQIGPWIPLGLLTVEMGVRAGSWTSRILWWGATGAVMSQVTAGFFGKGTYFGIMTIGAFAAYRTFIDPPKPLNLRRRLLFGVQHCAGILVLGFLLSSVTTLPRLDYLERTNLSGGDYSAVDPGAAAAPSWSLGRALKNLITLDDLKYGVGPIAVALAAAALILVGRRYAAPYFALLAIVVVSLTMRPNFVHDIFYLLPRFQVTHEHVAPRILVVLNIAPALLAGMTITAIQRREVTAARLAAAAAGIAGATAIFVGTAERDRVRFDLASRNAMLAAGLTMALAALFWFATRSASSRVARAGSVAIAAFMTAALVWSLGAAPVRVARDHGLTIPGIFPVPLAYADRIDAGEAGEFLRQETTSNPARFLGYDVVFLSGDEPGQHYYHTFTGDLRTEAILVNNRAILLRLQDAQGYSPVHTQRYVEYIDAMNGRAQEYHELNLLPGGIGSPMLDLLNVRYIVVPLDVPPGRPDLLRLSQLLPTVYQNDRVRILENRSALPRAWLVHEVVQIEPGEAPALLSSGTVDPRRTALIESSLPAVSPATNPEDEHVEIDRYEADRIALSVTASAEGLLVLSEIDDPGWRAYVNGERVEIVVANHIFRAISLPAGSHSVEFRYESRPLQLGIGVTLTTIVFLIAVAIYAGVRRIARDPLRLV